MRGGSATFGSRGKRLIRWISLAISVPLCCSLPAACIEETFPAGGVTSSGADETPESQAPNAAPPSNTSVPDETSRRYDGLTLDQWKERLKTLGPGVPDADEAVPGLRTIAEDRLVEAEFRNQVTMMLGRLGKPGLAALPTLEKLLQEPPADGAVPAVWSAKAIALLGPPAKDSVPVLIEVLEAPGTPVEAQMACLEALARIGGHHPGAIPAVVRTLKRAAGNEEQPADRTLLMAAIDAFVLIGPGASIAVPELTRLLDQPQELIRLKVVESLGAIGASASPAANTLAEMLIFDDSDAVRNAAAVTLAAIGPEGRELLLHLAADEEAGVRQRAVEALSSVSPRDAELEKVLEQALSDEAAEVRLAAAVGLKSESKRRDEVLRVLTRLIAEPNRSVKLSAANQLSSMQPDDDEWNRLRTEVEDQLDGESIRLWERIERMRGER